MLAVRSGLALVICGAILASVAALAHSPPSLSVKHVATLERGEIIVESMKPSGGGGVAARVMGIVDARPVEVWPIVRDCQHYAQFMPRTERSEVRGYRGKASICFVEIDMPFPLSNLWSESASTLTELPGGGFERSWSMIRGNYTRNNGSWRIFPWSEGGARSLIVYRIDTDPDMIIPDAILRSAQTGSLPDVFTAVRNRVRERRRP